MSTFAFTYTLPHIHFKFLFYTAVSSKITSHIIFNYKMRKNKFKSRFWRQRWRHKSKTNHRPAYNIPPIQVLIFVSVTKKIKRRIWYVILLE